MAAFELTKTVLKDSTNLKAYYRFESGALTTDSSGQGKTLTNNNTATETTGVYGGGVALNGTDQTMSIADVLVSGATNWSVSTWVKLDSLSKTGQIWYCGAYPTSGFGVITTNGTNGGAGDQISLLFHNVGWFHTGVSIGTTTSFVHIVVTRDTTTTRVYLNGKHIYLTTTAPTAPAGAFVIGKDGTGGSYYFDGSIDDLAVFNTALSADQIKELYEGRFIGEAWPQSGLVAGYHLSNGTDFSGNNNHSDAEQNPTYGAAYGKFGSGLMLSGTGYVRIPDSASLEPGTNLTLSAWIKRGVVGAGQYVIVGKSNYTGNAYSFQWEFFNDTLRFITTTVTNTSNTYRGTTTTFTSTTVWNHYAVTFDSGTILLYANGNLQPMDAKTGTATTIPNTNSPLAIGGQNVPSALEGPFNGSIDELLMFNRSLTPQEIRRMYAVGVGKLQ